MALTMDAATYGRDSLGRERLKSDFNEDIQALINVCNGSKYNDIVKCVRANWVGDDADDFLKDLAATKAKLEKSLKALRGTFNSAIDADAKQFAKFQKNNVK